MKAVSNAYQTLALPRLPVWAAFFLTMVCFAILALSGWREWTSRDAELKNAEVDMANLARSVTQHAEDTIELADATLIGLVSNLQANRMDALAIARIQDFLELRKATLGRVKGLFVYDETGRWLATSDKVTLTGMNNSDRAYFQHHKVLDDGQAYLGRPVKSRSSSQWIITVSRRLNHPDGSFAGVVVATIETAYFAQFYRQFDIGPSGSITMLSADGILLARSPDDGTLVGRDMSGTPLIKDRMSRASASAYYFKSPLDGMERLSSFRFSDRYPIVLLATQAQADVLAQWRQGAVTRTAFVWALTLLIGIAGIYLVRQLFERQRLAEALAAKEADFRLLAENSSDLIMLTSKFGRRIYVSPAVRSMLGYEPSEFAGIARQDLIHPADFERVKEIYEAVGPDCEKAVSTHRIKHRDGHFVWVEALFTWTYAVSDAGEPTVIGAFRDISDRRNAEEARLESESRYKLLAETTSDVITRLNLDFKRVYISPACRELFGYEPEEMLGNQPSASVHPDDALPVRELAKALVGGAVQGDRGTATYRAQHKDGHWVWIEAVIDLVRDPDTGQPSSLVCALRDVSIRQQQARELELAKDEAEKAARTKTEFLASMSHELRTPLNSIIGFSGLMIRSGELKSPAMERYARLVEGASTTLLSIVNDVLDVSKIEAGGFELDPHKFEVRRLVEDAVELVHQEAEAKGLPLRVQWDPKIPVSLVGDANRLRQVLLNLLSNAVKFTSSGHVTMSANLLESDQAGCRLSFAVEDTGIGVPADKQHRLFKRFSQVDGSTARQFGGTGLGLSICKSLIEMMGGKIAVVSEPGQGSTFSFDLTLPLAASPVVTASPNGPVLAKGAFILLAEDVPMNQELAVALLMQQGHRIDVVADGAAAVDAVMRMTYDLVLMDVQMPVMDGVEATTRIRSLGGDYLDLPIIAMTANVMWDDVARFRDAGMNDHVGKPFKHDELFAAVARWTAEDAQRFDDTIYAKLSQTISEPTVKRLIGLFQTEIVARFFTSAATIRDNRREILTRIHRIASTAGMLGFVGLSAKCRALEQYADGGDDLTDHLAEIEVERFKALSIARRLLMHQVPETRAQGTG